jgi:hypothetical protein
LWKAVNQAYQAAYQRSTNAAPMDNPTALQGAALWANIKAKLPAGVVTGRNFSAWAGDVMDAAAGFLDTLTGGLTRYLRMGMSWLMNQMGLGSISRMFAINEGSTAYRYGTYAGQIANIALTLIPGVGWIGVAIKVINTLQAIGGAIGAVDALIHGDYVGGALGLLGALLHGARALGGTRACSFLNSGTTLGTVIGRTQQVLGIINMARGAVNGVQRIISGDVIGGLLDIGQAAADLYVSTRSCFTGEMLMDTAEGKRRADSIRVGDLLWARPEHDPDGELALKAVEEVFVRVAPILNVHVAGQILRTTFEHPFYVEGQGWTPAGQLRIGDRVRARDGSLVYVEGVADSGEVTTVYNWRVADYHTYFVSATQEGISIWVHNATYHVYVLKKNGKIVYVGITDRPPKERLKEHARSKKGLFDKMEVIATNIKGGQKVARRIARNIEGSMLNHIANDPKSIDGARQSGLLNKPRKSGGYWHGYHDGDKRILDAKALNDYLKGIGTYAPPNPIVLKPNAAMLSEPVATGLGSGTCPVTLPVTPPPAAATTNTADPTAVAFTTRPQTLTAGQPAVLTVELRDADGSPTQAGGGGLTLHLGTNSARGSFWDVNGHPLTGLTITVPAGASSVSFLYQDGAFGFPTLTVTAADFSATQQETVTAGTPVYTPAQIRTAYGINGVAEDGTGQTIAIVTAYDAPSIFQSVDAFDTQFGATDSGPSLYQQYGAASSFLTVLNQQGQAAALPAADPGGPGNADWAQEAALDVEWAHAIAPGARIVLVEARSTSLADLMAGVVTAADQPGVSVVSLSWGFAEGRMISAAQEAIYDTYLTTPAGHQGVTFVASTGDQGTADPEYPAFSPNVVAVGGTSLSLNPDGSYQGETGWGSGGAFGGQTGSGGGLSGYESEPAYQRSVQSTGRRSTPDVALDADPATGVWIADPYNGSAANPWKIGGGTSLAAPAWAGLFALINQGRVAAGERTLNSSSPTEALQALYSLSRGDYHDIVGGSNGGNSATAGYDLVTGLGSPIAQLLIRDLIAYLTPGQPTAAALGPDEPGTGSPGAALPQVPSLTAAASQDGTPARSAAGTTAVVPPPAPTTGPMTAAPGTAGPPYRTVPVVPSGNAVPNGSATGVPAVPTAGVAGSGWTGPTLALDGQATGGVNAGSSTAAAAAAETAFMAVAQNSVYGSQRFTADHAANRALPTALSVASNQRSASASAAYPDVNSVPIFGPFGGLPPALPPAPLANGPLVSGGAGGALLGGQGDELLIGGSGRDFLIGGFEAMPASSTTLDAVPSAGQAPASATPLAVWEARDGLDAGVGSAWPLAAAEWGGW